MARKPTPKKKYKTSLMPRPKPERIPDDPHRCRPTQVAAMLGCRYQRARDRMLAGEFGPPEYKNRRLTVARDAVIRARVKQDAERDAKRRQQAAQSSDLPKS